MFYLALLLSASLTVCSQNLQRPELGDTEKIEILSERISKRKCDIIALQEVTGKSEKEASSLVNQFKKNLKGKYESVLAGTNDSFIRNGLLYNPTKIKLLRSTSYEDFMLPQIDPRRGNSAYSRGPLFALVEVGEQKFLIANFHFKSKYGGWKDPYRRDYELKRMEMAAGVRELVKKELERSPKGTKVILLGDRNSDREDAANLVLTGKYKLNDFTFPNDCRVERNYKPKCKTMQPSSPDYISLVDIALSRQEPYKRRWGSYKRKGKSYLLDDILVPPKDSTDLIEAGFEGLFRRGSDHLMVWAKLDFN